MVFTYPAIFKKEADGTYSGRFPDLEACTAHGATLDEAINDAIDAERNWLLVEMEEEDVELPPVTHMDDLVLEEGEIARSIGAIVKLYEGWGD